jgi:hypothetical protein
MAKNFTLKPPGTRNNADATVTAKNDVGHSSIANQYNAETGKQGGTVAVANLQQPRGGKGMRNLSNKDR